MPDEGRELWEIDGLHLGVPFPDYANWPLMSQSTLKEGRKSMAHLYSALVRERVKVPTGEMTLGSALHTAFLEPEQAAERIAVWEGGTRRGKEWEAFKTEHAAHIILTETQAEQLDGMTNSLRRHPEVCKWRRKIQSVETSCVGMVNGLRMKGRCDALTADPLIDLKKVADGDHRKMINSVLNYGYHLQGWIYGQLFQRDRFMLITVEDEPPYDVCAFELSSAFLRAGKREASSIIERFIECEKTGVWPGRSMEPVELQIPTWAMPDPEINYGVYPDGI